MSEKETAKKVKVDNDDWMENVEKMSIDDKIGYWHTHETGNSLIEFLEMTEQEYFDFCIDGIKATTEK